MHMEIEWNLLMLIGIVFLLVVQVTCQIILEQRIRKALVKMDRYVKYILEDGEGTSSNINIEETPPKGLDERQKELLLQEVLEGFLA